MERNIHVFGAEMSEDLRAGRGSRASAALRKRAAHWRRVAHLVSDAVMTHVLRSRANSLEREAENIDRETRDNAAPHITVRPGAGPRSPRSPTLRWRASVAFHQKFRLRSGAFRPADRSAVSRYTAPTDRMPGHRLRHQRRPRRTFHLDLAVEGHPHAALDVLDVLQRLVQPHARAGRTGPMKRTLLEP